MLTAPPSPIVRWCGGQNDWVEISPHVPVYRVMWVELAGMPGSLSKSPWGLGPGDRHGVGAAKGIAIIFNQRKVRAHGQKLEHGPQNRKDYRRAWAIITALVFPGEKASSIRAGRMLTSRRVIIDERTGTAPYRTIGVTVVGNPAAAVITSSPEENALVRREFVRGEHGKSDQVSRGT